MSSHYFAKPENMLGRPFRDLYNIFCGYAKWQKRILDPVYLLQLFYEDLRSNRLKGPAIVLNIYKFPLITWNKRILKLF